MRVISLTCSNTEIVCALGCADLLVGVDNHSDYPAEVVAKLPRVGPDLGVEIDKVIALRPDLVLASLTVPGHEKVVNALQQAGLNYIAPEPVSLEDVYQDIVTIGGRLEVEPRGHELVAQMKKLITLCAVDKFKNRPSIMVQWWPKPVIAPGRHSWVHDLILAAGGINPMAQRDVKSTPLEDHEVRSIDPDAMVISWCGVRTEKYRPEVVYRNESWKTAKFIVNGHVHCIPEALLGRPSPRLVEGYHALKDLVRRLRD
ncbi:MAG: helical backbone metal receptor [Gammaproteobacteria bacterium]|nr:helical backbone metal receptor [Gammaproteobacteria bacterium]